MCNQRLLMAPHYAKRRAKGAWHFLSRQTKNQERLAASCERALFLRSLVGDVPLVTVIVVAAAAIAVFPVTDGGGDSRTFHPSMRDPATLKGHDTSRIPRSAVRCKSCAFGSAYRHRIVVLFVSASALSPPPLRQRYNPCIDVSNLLARDAAAIAAATAAASCIDARRSDAT